MSEQSAVEFLRKVSEDEVFGGKLHAAVEGEPDQHAAIAEFGREHGHDFTAAELSSVLALHREAQAQLSDEELEQISGGFQPQPEPPGRRFKPAEFRFDLPTWIR